MKEVSTHQYEYALARIEQFLPLVDDDTPFNGSAAMELSIMSEVMIDYQTCHFPIGKPVTEYATK